MNKKHILFYIVLSFLFLVPRVGIAQDEHDHHEHEEHDDYEEYEEHEDHDDHEEHDDHSEEGHEGHEEEGVHVNEQMQEVIGLTFEKVQLREYEQKIKVYGEIAQDTDKYTHITSKHNGVVKKVYIQTGSIVDAGEPMVSITKDDGTVEIMPAPHHGTAIAIHVKPGDRVDNLRSLASLADLDKLRVSFDVYEKDLRFVSVGQRVNVRSTAYPDNVFKGKVVFVSPRIDKNTQTIKIRAEVDNDKHLLRLGMFVIGELIFTTGGKVMSVSQSAVQQIEDENVVFVSERDDFKAKEIDVGREFGEFIEVTKGVHEGEQIVSKGSFALKSELQKGAFGDGHNH